MDPAAKPDVSVCIATCRRPEGIARLLESLGRMKRPEGVVVEVIVVDNDPAATTASRRSASRRWEERVPDFRLHRIDEPRRNIAHARNAAVAVARGAWLAFVDDDECVDEGWLDALWRCAEGDDADAWFGPVLPRLVPGGSLWVAGFFDRPRFPTGTEVSEANARTGNALVRRSLFEDGAFDPAYGESGGEDTHFFWKRSLTGARYRWCDEAIVSESVPANRQRPSWLLRRAFRGGSTYTRIAADLGRGEARFSGLVRRSAGAVAFAVASLFGALRSEADALRWAMRAATQIGRAWALLGNGRAVHRR